MDDNQLAHFVYRSFVVQMRQLGLGSGAYMNACADSEELYLGPQLPLRSFNHHCTGPLCERYLTDIRARYRQEADDSAPSELRHLVWDHEDPELRTALERSGYRERIECAGMALEIHGRSEDVAVPLGTAGLAQAPFSIVEPESPTDAQRWARVYAAAHAYSSEKIPRLVEVLSSGALRANKANEAPARHFLGLVDGDAAACAKLIEHKGYSGLYMVGVHPAFRRRGFGTAITRHCIEEARAAGYSYVVLQADPPAVSLYEGLGFQHCSRLWVYRCPL